MYYSRKERLFSKYTLDDYLRQLNLKMENEIKHLTVEQIETSNDSELVDNLVAKYQVSPPMLKKDGMKIEPKETSIDVGDNSRFNHRLSTVQGYAITVSIPFEGAEDLFFARPSKCTLLGTPEAEIKDEKLFLSYETTEEEPEKIKALWKNDIGEIDKNLEWITADLATYTNSLENGVRKIFNERKEQAQKNKDIFEQLKD